MRVNTPVFRLLQTEPVPLKGFKGRCVMALDEKQPDVIVVVGLRGVNGVPSLVSNVGFQECVVVINADRYRDACRLCEADAGLACPGQGRLWEVFDENRAATSRHNPCQSLRGLERWDCRSWRSSCRRHRLALGARARLGRNQKHESNGDDHDQHEEVHDDDDLGSTR